MKAGVIYTGQFLNAQFALPDNSELQQDIIVTIFDMETLIEDSADPVNKELQPGDSPAIFSAVDNDEDKFHVVRGKQFQFIIHSGNGIDINEFASGGDRRFRVEVSINDLNKLFWTGFLDISSLAQDFQPDPNEISLIANDGLGSLGSIALTNFDGTNPTNENRIADYLTWALSKTGLSLKIYAIFNLQPVLYSLSGTTVTARWVKIELNGGATIHYFLDVPAVGFYDVPQPSPPPFPTSQDMSSATLVAAGPADFALYIVAHYTGWINGIQYPGDTISLSGSVLVPTGGGHIFDKCYLNAKTFEKEIGESEDCLSVLKKILGEYCYLEQYKGRWYIIDEDEKDRATVDQQIFNEDGTLGDALSPLNIDKSIGVDLDLSFMDDDAIVSLERPFASVKETFNYEMPKEPICNIDFVRGALIAGLPDEILDGITLHAKSYALECWLMKRGFPLHTPITNDSTAYIKRLFNDNDYEKERYVVITFPSANNVNTPYIESEPVYIDRKDKFTASVDFRFPDEITSGGGFYNIMNCVLHGDDDTWWILGRDEPGNTAEPKWYNTLGFTVFTNKGEQGFNFATSANDADWQNQSFEAPPAPVGGKLYLWLNGMNTAADAYDNVNIYYQNLIFDYIPLINGSYQKYSGQYHKMSQIINTVANRDQIVYVSDSPKKLFKGALLIKDDAGEFQLAPQFFNPYTNRVKPYGEHQGWAVWNQFNRIMRKFEATIDGLQTESFDGVHPNLPSMLHRFRILDVNPSTSTNGVAGSKCLQLLHFEQDLFQCSWKAFLHETFDTEIAKKYTDTHEFKYVQQTNN